MEKRPFGKMNIDIPLLGMGLMRPPMLEDGKTVDEPQFLKMIETMYDAGVRYFDTAYVYLDGESERLARKGLVEKYDRSSFYLADKLPMWPIKEPEDCEKIFSTSLERLGTDYIDFYLLHALDYEDWCKAKENGAAQFQRRIKEEGRVRHIGFSFHGPASDLEKILTEQPDWDFVQLQVNYYDWYTADTEKQYELLEQRGIPCVVMEPVRGGNLVELGDDVREIFARACPEDSNVGVAMRWVGSLPNIKVVLSGISSMEQAQENIKIFDPLRRLSLDEEEAVIRAVNVIKERSVVPCTGCGYCGECPQGVDIKAVFKSANEYKMLCGKNGSWRYNNLIRQEHDASRCVACGACSALCPQSINIPEMLKVCHSLLTDKQ